jgi:hypothetical protein
MVCHPERSEASDALNTEMLRCAQDDNLLPILMVKVHYRPGTLIDGLNWPIMNFHEQDR